MFEIVENLRRNAKAKAQAAAAIPPNPMDCRRPPSFAPKLPYEMGAGGWPVEEPTQEQMDHFLECLKEVPPSYFSSHKEPLSPDYGTQYTSAIKVKQWLRLIAKSGLLTSGSG